MTRKRHGKSMNLRSYFKHFVLQSTALSLLYVTTSANATVYTVTNSADDGTTANTLRVDMNIANSSSGNTIQFNFNLPTTINLSLGVLPTVTNNMTINSTTSTGSVLVNAGSWTNPLFAINSGTLTLISNNSIGGAVSWFGSIANNATLIFNQTQTSTYGGNITGTGNVQYSGTIGQTLSLTGASTYGGSTNISSGTVAVGINNALPATTALNLSTLNGTLSVSNGFSQTVAGLSGNGTIDLPGTGVFTLNSNSNNTFAGLFTGTGNFVKTGTGTVSLSNFNMGTGTLTVNNGVAKIATSGRWNGPIQITSVSGSTPALEMNGGTVTGTITGDGTANSILNVTANFTPNTVITNVGQLNVNNGGNFALYPGFVPSGFLAFNVNTGGVLNLNTDFTVPTNVPFSNAGTINMNNHNILMSSGSTLNNSGIFSTSGTIGAVPASTGYAINVTGGTFTANNAISGYNSLTVSNGGEVVLDNPGSLSNGIVLANGGIFTYKGGTFTGNVSSTGNSTMNVNANFGIPGSIAVNTLNVNDGTFTSNNQTSVTNLLNVGAFGTLLFGNNLTMPVNAELTTADGSTVTMNNYNLIMGNGGTLNLNGPLSTTGTISSTGTYNINVGATGNFTVNNAVSNYGALSVAAGGETTLVNLGSLSNGIFLNGGTFTYGGGTFTGNVTSTAGSIMNVNSNFNNPGSVSVDFLNVNNGVFTSNSGINIGNTVDIGAAGTLSLGSNLTIPANGALTNAGAFNMNGFSLLMSSESVLNTGTFSTTGPIAAANNTVPPYTIVVPNSQTFTVNNPVSGYDAPLTIAAGVFGGSVVLNNGGSLSGSLDLNSGYFTVNGGSYVGNVNGDANSTMNINTTFTPPGVINVGNINVNRGGIFTPNATVTAQTLLNVNGGGTLLLANDITGPVINGGTIVQTTNTLRTINGDFTQAPAGLLELGISTSDPGQYAQIQVNGTATFNGGSIKVDLPYGTGAISDGEVFNVLPTTNPIVIGALPTVLPTASRFLTFNPIANGNTFQLVAKRIPYEDATTTDAFDGVAQVLDNFVGPGDEDNGLYTALLNAVDQADDIDDFLAQLAPAGVNDSIYLPSILTLDAFINSIGARLDAMRSGGVTSVAMNNLKTGYAAGDMLENQASYGPLVFGNFSKQANRNGLPGYNATTGGAGVSVDVPILEYFRVGLGLSYASTAVKQSDNSGSNTTINSTQAMGYGSATYGPLFLDGMLAVGVNQYNGKRNIALLGQTLTATSNYRGFQYGAKVKAGFSVPCYQVEFSPMATFQYSHLNTSSYTEKGASILNLSVNSTNTDSTRVGLGARIADRSQEEDFFPELHALYIFDIKNPNVQITSRFIDGGTSFVSKGAAPPKSGINVGGSLSALVTDNFVVMGGYDLEAKKTFRSHSVSFKFKWLF